MSTYFDFLIPPDKEILNLEVKKFVFSRFNDCIYNETKDGFAYSIEFKSQNELIKFKSELIQSFPNLYK